MISLVNPATGELVGAGTVSGGSASIDLNGLSQGTNLTLTVTGINVRPYIANILIDSNAVVPNVTKPMNGKQIAFAASLIQSGIQLTIPTAGLWTVTLYSADGRTLWHSQQNLGIGNNTIGLAGFHQAAGMKILSVDGPGIKSTQRIIER